MLSVADTVRRRFVLPGQPHPAERPRRVQRGRKAVWITPDRTLAAEQAVADAYRAAYPGAPPFIGEVTLSATLYRHTRRHADLDNLLKTVMDGLTKAAAWGDDSQVAEYGTVRRVLGVPLAEARTEVELVGQCATLVPMTDDERNAP